MSLKPFATLLLALATACDLGTGAPDIQFTNSLLPSADVQASADVQTGAGALYGTGIMRTPNTCQKLTASVKITGNSFIVSITASNQRSPCDGGIGAYTYQFAIGDLDPRRYSLKVVYDYNGQKPAETVLEQDIVVT